MREYFASTVRRLLRAPCSGFALVMLGCSGAAPPASSPSPLLREPLPALGRSLDGVMFDRTQLAGRVVVVKFFAKYCKPCEQTLPHAQQLHEEYPAVTFIGVSLDESTADLAATIQRYHLTFPIIHDRANLVSGRFRVREMPTTFVVDKEGRVHWVAGPEQAEQALDRALASLL